MNIFDNEEAAKDAIFRALAHEHRRIILEYLAEQPEEEVDCTDVVDHLSLNDTTEADYEALDIQCHHVHFPKLDKSGLIKLDVDEDTIHIVRRETIEKLADLIDVLE